MNAPIRLMLVDDSSVIRRLLTQALAQHPEVEVVGTAANGIIALNKLPQLNPDLVVLDVEMPEMDGITMLQQLRQTHPRLPVVMFSTLTERGASVTFDALAAGASDYVLKPSTQTGETLDQVVATSLVPKIIALTRSRFGLALQAAMAAADLPLTGPRAPTAKPSVASPSLKPSLGASSPFAKQPITGSFAPKAPRGLSMRPPERPSRPRHTLSPSSPRFSMPAEAPTTGTKQLLRAPQPSSHTAPPAAARTSLQPSNPLLTRQPTGVDPQRLFRKPVQLIAIAASTGGPNALAEVVPRLPKNLPVPIVLVQHMPPIFTRCLADRLNTRSELEVIESEGRERLQAGRVYIAPGTRHLEVVREGDQVFTRLSDGPPENSCRPAADVLFRSVARAYGGTAMCVVLTGMGHDGLLGARAISEAGGRVLVQSGPTCVVWGMPKAIEEAGLAEAVVPLPEIAAAILQRVGLGLTPVRPLESGR